MSDRLSPFPQHATMMYVTKAHRETLLVLLLVSFLLNTSLVWAQNGYIITGKVTDAQTGEGIPFATVGMKGKALGTQSDFEGNYRLSVSSLTDSLLISSLGYAAKSMSLTRERQQTIHVQLVPTAQQLTEVVVRARGQDPAYRILRQVDEHRKQNDFAQLNAYQWEAYNRITISVQNLSERFKQRKMIRDIYDKIAQFETLRDKNATVVIPVYSSESVSSVFFRKDPVQMKEVIQKSYAKGLGVTDENFIAQLTASGYNTINFYQNWIGLFRKEFRSPLAKAGTGFYTYFLRDTVQVGLHPCYQIDFDPKNEHDLAFRGTMWIDTASHALVQIDATVEKSANINFIDKIQIQQEYEQLGPKEDTWIPEKTRIVIDASGLFDRSTGVVVGMTVRVKDVIPHQPKPSAFFDTPVAITPDSQTADDSFWRNQRQEKMTEDEQLSLALIDTVSQVRSFKRLARLVDFGANGGFMPLSRGLDFGSTFFSYAYNSIEHHRFWAGIRTSPGFSKKWFIKAYLAYGTRDKLIKRGLEVSYTPSTAPLTRLGFQTDFDIDQIGIRQADLGDNPLFRLASRFGKLNGAFYQRDIQFFLQRNVLPNLTSTITLRHRRFYPVFHFRPAEFRNNRYSIVTPFSAPEASIALDYIPNRLPTRNPNRIRVRAGNTAPRMGVSYTVGHISDAELGPLEKSLGDYHILKAHFSHTLRFGIAGKTDYTLKGMYTPSLLPVNLLSVHQGNETFLYAKNAFNLMRYSEFASDRSVSFSVHHSFEGLVTNRVPVLNRWQLRTFAVGNILVGSLRPENETLVSKYLPAGDSALSQLYLPKSLGSVPYVEVGYGIDNIFRILRVVAIHRLTHLDAPGSRSFGIRAAIHLSF
ncbi:hypothetical protein GCM10027347_55560 [Larkinella harenae]